jgi:hypothetical protein
MINNTFDNYKKSLEDYLQNIDFIYSGDVINSIDKKYVNKLKHSSFSAHLFREIMVDIYNYSFNKMLEKSKEIIIHRNKFSDIYELMHEIPIDPKILFYSVNSNMNLGLGSHLRTTQATLTLEDNDDGHSYLPSYFNRRFKLMSYGKEVSAYYSPSILDDVDDCHFYLIDRPIQSMVWSLQNMTYTINKSFSNNEHVLKFPIYNCDYTSYKIRVIDTQKIREDKINILLNEN